MRGHFACDRKVSLTNVTLVSEMSDLDIVKNFQRVRQEYVENMALEPSIVGLEWVRVSEIFTTADKRVHAFTAATIKIVRRILSNQDVQDRSVCDSISVPKLIVPSVERDRERRLLFRALSAAPSLESTQSCSSVSVITCMDICRQWSQHGKCKDEQVLHLTFSPSK